MSIYLRNFLRYCLLVWIQVTLLDKVSLRWWAEPFGFPIFVPMIYPLAMLLLPFNTPKWLQYILAFLCGLSIDMFCNTMGMHAMATLIMVRLRDTVLGIVLPKNINEYGGQTPSVKNMGWLPFFTYAASLIILHHFIFFSLQLWSWQNFLYLLIKTIASSFTSLLFVLVYTLLFTKTPDLKTAFKKG